MRLHHLTIPFALFALAGAASAQTPQSFPACENQQELEQVLASGGDFMPDGCRRLSITALDSDEGRICVIDFEPGESPGVLDRLADATLPTQWWVLCENLATID